jgi:isoleucyl-tRNA synthetase
MTESTTYNPLAIEKRILEFWKKNEIFKKLVRKNSKGKRFSFIDGPITANNPMGVHHAWGRMLKDLFLRYRAMQGFHQRYQNGFDCQGLWVEVEVEKDLGFNSKHDIEKFGLENFSKACRERVNKFTKRITDQSIRLGQWMDWNNSYYTFTDENIEAIWFFLKRCNENKWLYEGTRVMPWCYRCGTSLSQHEQADSYTELVHPGLFVKFKIKGRENEYLLVWTTTAWTLSSNVAVAVHPDLDYVKAKKEDEYLYLSKGTTRHIGEHEVVEMLKGSDLIGMEYESLYPDFEAQQGVKQRVVGWDGVSEEEGTGIVHIAPGCGAEDHELGKEENLAEIAPLDEFGYFVEGFGWLTGKNVKDTAQLVIEDLKKRELLFKVEDYRHSYPVCWRCKEELVFRLVKEWFIKSDEIRPRMKKEAAKVVWYPEFVGKLMQDWLTNMGDWCISRKRYWGLPLPFYRCECGHIEVIGSRKELREKAVNPKLVDSLPELHRPWIDEIKIKCPKCKAAAERVKEVGDCWLDAGIVPFSTLKYFSDKKYWRQWFPADFISEMREQVKLWFYSILFMSVTLEGVTCYKSVLSYERVNDEKGNPMHKSFGNVIWFDDAAERMGADVMRWMFVKQNPHFNLNFGYTPGKEVHRTLNILYNTTQYVKTYCEANNYKPRKTAKRDKRDLAGRWIISRLESLKKNISKNIEEMKYHIAAKAIEDFFLYDFSRWYIHIIRSEVKPGEESENKKIILSALYYAMLELLKLVAPFLPFFAEHCYQEFYKKFEETESIHLMEWPKANEKLIDDELNSSMEIVRAIVEASFSARESAKIKRRWPVSEMLVVSKDKSVAKAVKELEEILLKMCNCKNMRLVKEKPRGEFCEGDFSLGKIYLGKKLDEKLLEEALIRELIREIQALRKKYGFHVRESIQLTVNSDEKTNKMLNKYTKILRKEVGAKRVDAGKLKGKFKGQLKFEDKNIDIAFEKV